MLAFQIAKAMPFCHAGAADRNPRFRIALMGRPDRFNVERLAYSHAV